MKISRRRGALSARPLMESDQKTAIAFAMNLEADIYRPYIANLYELLFGGPMEIGPAVD
jgi:hypothetical protein